MCVYGNARYLQKQGETLYNEKRWIPNQIIQGTASFILKKSILKLSTSSDSMKFLIPMHDAILLEVPNEKINEAKQLVEKIFLDVFSEVCPNINTGISFEEFTK
jgi:DNA polymerase I-like protein with 3'-5' exonuclease and polymerase domains